MSIYQAIISGIVQGVTEFFPISSSGHLVILHEIFGLKETQVAFDVFLHLGTILAVAIFFWKDILELFVKNRRLLWIILVGSIPAFLIGILFKDRIEELFGAPRVVGYMLIVTGVWIGAGSIAVFLRKKAAMPAARTGFFNAVIIGIAQGIAIMPGISRSGSTISTGLILGLEPEAAARFSFLLSIPAVLGACVLKAAKIGSGIFGPESLYYILGALAAFAAGLVAIKTLLQLITRRLFFIFAVYCVAAGMVVLFFLR